MANSIKLEKAQFNIMLDALEERVRSLQESAASKIPSRPGSHRHQLELEAHGIVQLIHEIREQWETNEKRITNL